jgi:hypothetical protein
MGFYKYRWEVGVPFDHGAGVSRFDDEEPGIDMVICGLGGRGWQLWEGERLRDNQIRVLDGDCDKRGFEF